MVIKRKFPPRVATVYCSGGHDELIQEDGIYADFVGGKKETDGWKL